MEHVANPTAARGAGRVGWAQRYSRQLVDRFRPPELNDNVLALDIAEFAQARPEGLDPASASGGGTKAQEADPVDLPVLLRLRNEGPSVKLTARTTARPISRMGTWWRMACGSQQT
jgi:hypothetical protein